MSRLIYYTMLGSIWGWECAFRSLGAPGGLAQEFLVLEIGCGVSVNSLGPWFSRLRTCSPLVLPSLERLGMPRSLSWGVYRGVYI